MTNGRVLDATAIADIAGGGSQYGRTLLSVAAEYGIDLAIPASALQAVWQGADVAVRPWLELLPDGPTVVVLDLDVQVARDAGTLAADSGHPDIHPSTAHAAYAALERDWPVVTRDPDALLSLNSDIRTETIP